MPEHLDVEYRLRYRLRQVAFGGESQERTGMVVGCQAHRDSDGWALHLVINVSGVRHVLPAARVRPL